MGGLWLILAVMQVRLSEYIIIAAFLFICHCQLYLYFVLLGYGKQQQNDHEQYKSLYSVASYNDIPMTANRGDPWDARPSMDETTPMQGTYGHARNESEASVSTILGEKQQQPRDLEYSISNQAPSGLNPSRGLSVDNTQYQQNSSSYDAYSPYTGTRGNNR